MPHAAALVTRVAATIEKLAAQDPRRAGTAASLDAKIAAKRKELLKKRKHVSTCADHLNVQLFSLCTCCRPAAVAAELAGTPLDCSKVQCSVGSAIVLLCSCNAPVTASVSQHVLRAHHHPAFLVLAEWRR
jgi:hypothetical protein